MATKDQSLSSYNPDEVSSAAGYKFGIVVSEYNNNVTDKLLEAARDTLLSHQASESNITIHRVPGSFELTSGAQYLIETNKLDAVICLGCIIKGETDHDLYISQAVANGITNLSLTYHLPVIFGVLTTNTEKQAIERAGGSKGNKGVESAVTAIKMVAMRNQDKSSLGY